MRSSNAWIPAAVFLVLWIHGASLGLTEDEAYYWVLAQKPAWGYAFHPPLVAWVLAAFQAIFGFALGTHSAALIRLPAALISAFFCAGFLYWLKLMGLSFDQRRRGGLTFLGFAGLFGVSWMMVPDLPMLLGWGLAFLATWRLCLKGANAWALALALGVLAACLSKYTGVFVALSALGALLLWAQASARIYGAAAVGTGLMLSALPILIWNANHEWGALLYQFRDRHGGGEFFAHFSALRYARFWLVQLVVAGPALLIFSAGIFARARRNRISAYCMIWALPPALIFFIQPAFSDFKFHWTLIAWVPLAMELAALNPGRWVSVHRVYGYFMIGAVMVLSHVPWSGRFLKEPKFDPTNDMVGWSELPIYLNGAGGERLPVVGSRYQTAAQAAVVLGPEWAVTLLPRDRKQWDEWPMLPIVDRPGPEWPKLLAPVWFVADNKYTGGPEFRSADCVHVVRLPTMRGGYLARWLDLWKCKPK